MSMSDDDETYDADGDVSRFLHCPSPEAYVFPLSQPEGTLVGLCQNAPPAAIDEVQGGHQVPQTTLNAAPDLLGHQVPTMAEFQGLPATQALGVAPDFGVQAPTGEFQGHPPPAPDFVLPVPAINADERYQAPIINAEQHQASAMDVEYYQPMAMDNIEPTQMLDNEMNHDAYGGFPDPTPSLFQANNVHMLANGVINPDPSPSSVYEQLVNDGEPELAAILWDIERGDNAGASGGAALIINDVHPVKEDVFFQPFIHGQVDCSQCRSVREVVCQDERQKMHFMVHASDPGMNFQHAIVHRMCIGADGHFCTEVLLHHDLRGRNHEWVHNFIARSVEMMKRNRGQIQDTNNCAPVSTNVATAPTTTSIHAHMEQLEAMFNNVLSGPAATTAAQPAVKPQEQGNINGPGVAETAAPEAAEPAVTPQEQGENRDAPVVTYAPGVAETTIPEAAQPGVTAPQEQDNTNAPAEGAKAAGPQAVQLAVTQNEEKKNAALFAPFNWEGFQPEILESSLVPPYDPESGTNVLLYPSLVEQLRQNELGRKESKRLSKMPALDTAAYLEMGDEDSANQPKLGSLASFRDLCQRDPTYRLYSRRVNCINRKITKLHQSAARVGTRGLFGLKQRIETYKREKAKLYEMINKAMKENERGGNNGAGPSNSAEPSNRADPSNEAGGTSNETASSSNSVISSSSDGAGTSNDAAGRSNAATPSSDGADISSDDAGPSKSNTAIVPSSSSAGHSGSK